jgi:hypothetical protein
MNFDSSALDLLEKMLHAVPAKRIRAEFALTHKFFGRELISVILCSFRLHILVECLEALLDSEGTIQPEPSSIVLLPDPQ